VNTASTEVGGGERAVKKISLAEMHPGESGKIVEIDAGYGLAGKLNALGITIGKTVTKISGHWMRGPVLLKQNSTQAAIGFGMASRIFVEVSERGTDK